MKFNEGERKVVHRLKYLRVNSLKSVIVYKLVISVQYIVSDFLLQSRSVKVDRLKLRRKVLYCFAISAIINEKLIKEDQPIRA